MNERGTVSGGPTELNNNMCEAGKRPGRGGGGPKEVKRLSSISISEITKTS